MSKQIYLTESQLPNTSKERHTTDTDPYIKVQPSHNDEARRRMLQLMAQEWDEIGANRSDEAWEQSQNGNFYRTLDSGLIVTVCLCKDGRWRGISDERITDESFDSCEEAMSAVDQGDVSFIPFPPRDTGWKAAKKGGFYRQVRGTTYSIKQTGNGSWFVMDGADLIKNRWFPTADAAKGYVSSLIGNEF